MPGMAPEGLNLLTLAALLKEVSASEGAQPRGHAPPIRVCRQVKALPTRPSNGAAQFRKAYERLLSDSYYDYFKRMTA